MWVTGSKKGETEKSYGGCTQGWRFQCDKCSRSLKLEDSTTVIFVGKTGEIKGTLKNM